MMNNQILEVTCYTRNISKEEVLIDHNYKSLASNLLIFFPYHLKTSIEPQNLYNETVPVSQLTISNISKPSMCSTSNIITRLHKLHNCGLGSYFPILVHRWNYLKLRYMGKSRQFVNIIFLMNQKQDLL